MVAPDGNLLVNDLAADSRESAERLTELVARLPGSVRVLKEPEESPFSQILLERGFSVISTNYEMEREL